MLVILRERWLVVLACFLLFLLGLVSLRHLNIEAYPDPAPPMIELITQKPGWSAEEMEQQITVPLEASLNGMPSLDHIRSSSLFGLSDIKCYFHYGASYQEVRQEVLNRIHMTELPTGVESELSPLSTIGELFRYQLVSDHHSLLELKESNDWILRRQFKQVPGVIDVISFGGDTKEFHVDLDPMKLMQFQLSVDDVMDALRDGNSNVGANYLDIGAQSYNVRGVGLFGGLADIENTVVREQAGVPVFVSQLGNVQLGRKIPMGRVGKDHQEDIVNGVVLMRPGGQSLPTLQAIHRKVAEINSGNLLPKGMRLEPYADRSKLIERTTATVQHTLVSGLVLIFLILLAFLGDLRASLVVALTIPLSLCVVFGVMVLTGQSANLISMGAIDFGIIVDATVIMVENIHRHLSFRSGDKAAIVAEAASEVTYPIVFSTAIIFVSFLPLFTMQGVEGKIFGPMASTYALALGGALLLGLTLGPVGSFLLLKVPEHGDHDTFIVRWTRGPYKRALTWVVDHPRWLVGIASVLLLLSGLILPFLGGEFMPKLEEGNLWVRATMPPSISFQEASRVANQAREIFLTFPEVRTVVSQLGRPDDGTDPISFSNCEFYVPLKPGLKHKAHLVERLERRLHTSFPGVDFNFSQAIEDNVKEAMSGVKGENSLKLVGADLAMLEKLAGQIEAALRDVPGVRDLGTIHLLGQPSLSIVTDRLAAARYGVSIEDVNSAVSASIGGSAATQVLEGDRRFDVVVRFQRPYRAGPQEIARIPIRSRSGAMIPLSQLARIETGSGAGVIYREDNQRYIPLKFSVRDRDLTSTIAEVKARIESRVRFPEGYAFSLSGEYEQLQQAMARLAVVVPITLALILLLLTRTFGSFRDALLVLATVPFAAIGGVLGLLSGRITLSISAAVGFISLFGVTVLQGVLFLSRVRQLHASGLENRAAILRAGELLLRPVLMVAAGAGIGLLPAALSSGIGSETQRPLATVVVGGMISCFFVILLVLPALLRLAAQAPLQAGPEQAQGQGQDSHGVGRGGTESTTAQTKLEQSQAPVDILGPASETGQQLE
ncbi:MAG: efflux RND transporter permease subunit [Candidatus Eremiobacteraeota bacterium]|nr:efflux RND transporter permease subunit [Candidatus Eremiobacteraeota bacterium]